MYVNVGASQCYYHNIIYYDNSNIPRPSLVYYNTYYTQCTYTHTCSCVLPASLCLQWSFGVVLWEVMSLGLLPYEDVPPEDMFSVLTSGHRLGQPKNCPEDMCV